MADPINLRQEKITVINVRFSGWAIGAEANDFSGITFFGQDWGGLIGLRLVVNYPERFDRVVISNLRDCRIIPMCRRRW